ncbi:MAG TPA: tripartite tricarboxylate transporter substrate-binding protein [Hyphomicrobiaceae bacterium]|nr:tripartite tricarboxylate transporter substrate-binding protein [Hyphomicrobiaceae bacterium]
MQRRRIGLSIVCAAAWLVGALAVGCPAALAQAAEEFYKGKTIRIIVALGAGGDYDRYARMAGRWLGKYIPASPNIVVENMPGAGGIIAANHIYNVAAKDGTVIGALHQNTALAQVTGTPNVEYDARKLNWIGRMSSSGLDVHHTWHTTGIKSFDDLFKREVVVGGGGPTSGSIILPTALNNLMGTKLKILGGYKGTAETSLALERGEIDMALQNWEALRANPEGLKNINLIVQYALERHPEVPNVPTIMELSKTEDQRQVWSLLLRPGSIGYSLAMPPGVPQDRVALLRKAFDAMVKDPGLQEEVTKSKLVLEPLSGAKVEENVAAMFKIDPAAIAKVKALLGR